MRIKLKVIRIAGLTFGPLQYQTPTVKMRALRKRAKRFLGVRSVHVLDESETAMRTSAVQLLGQSHELKIAESAEQLPNILGGCLERHVPDQNLV